MGFQTLSNWSFVRINSKRCLLTVHHHLSLPNCLPGLLPPTPKALQLCCATALFADIEKEGPKRLWQPRPRRGRLGRPQPRVRGQVQENKRGHWSDDQQTETVCKYLSMNPKPSSHLSFLFFPFFSPYAFCHFVLIFSASVATTPSPPPSLHLCLPPSIFLVVGPGRHWARRRTKVARARSSSLLWSSPHALKRNTNRLTRSLITWLKLIRYL